MSQISEHEVSPSTGAVLVVGGGMAGTQASLDLAEAGYRVYVVEEQPAIGGNMARVRSCWGSIRCASREQLPSSSSKGRVGEISPGMYCSMCTIPPQLADADRHKDVHLILGAAVEEITGEPGNFTVRVKKKPRYISEDDCVGCGDCVEVCPVSVTSEFEEHRAERKAVYRLYPQSAPSAYAIDKRGIPPCQQSCPAGVNTQAVMNLVGVGKFTEALEVLLERMPFPAACSVICSRPCEEACNRGDIDEPVAIRDLERAALEYGWEGLESPTMPEVDDGCSVAVIGAGPAGLTVGFGLMQKGISVTVYDRREAPGGSMRYGDTADDLPMELVTRDIERLVESGLHFVGGINVGADVALDELQKRHAAVVVATGVFEEKPALLQGVSDGAQGVFTCGACVTGETSLAGAVGSAWQIVEDVSTWLRDGTMPTTANAQARRVEEKLPIPDNAIIREIPRHEPAPGEGGVLSRDDAMAEGMRCLSCAVCSDCGECVKVCGKDALRLDDEGEDLELEVGAVLLTTGFDLFDARKRPEYGYGRYDNVVTSMELERMLNLSGPTGGALQRPSDGKRPMKIAFIQCVGSRETRPGGNFHCSSVCCLQSAKEAMVAQERAPGLQTTIFYMDLRAYGKGFEDHIEMTVDYGVRYERSMISTVKEVPGSKNLKLTYVTEEGERHTEEFDMVVLALAFEPTSSLNELARQLGIDLNESGFVRTRQLAPNETTQPGIFAGGSCTSPMDIPETIMDADSAGALAASLVTPGRGSLLANKEYPPERDVAYERPRVGVMVCHCGKNIGSVVDVPAVVEASRNLPNVVCAEEVLYACSQDAQQRIRELIDEYNLNRIVIAGCSPQTHEPIFQDTLREAGLNTNLLSWVDIRYQCAWVHSHEPRKATEKARDLAAMAVARARYLEPLPTRRFDVDQRGLVLGGGVAGMTASLRLAEQGFDVYLVEKIDRLGGQAWHVRESIDGEPVRPFLEGLIAEVEDHPRITTYLEASLKSIEGYLGNFETTLCLPDDDEPTTLEHGVVIVATGAREATTTEYLYGEHPAVVTQREFDQELGADEFDGDSVVFIQCVGSREPERPYCSRVCCTHTLQEAIEVKRRNPAASVHVLMREMRSYGFREALYQEARRLGVIFTRYEVEAKPEVTAKGERILVSVYDRALAKKRELEADRLVLATAIEPQDNKELAEELKVPLTDDGFFKEAYANLYQTDSSARGVFLCGLAHAPKDIGESTVQANAAALRAAALLGKQLEASGPVASVNERWCSGCGVCVEVCPYDARILTDEGVAQVIEVLCQGCGACATACPNGATQLTGFTKQQVIAMVDELASGGGQ